MNKLKEFSLFPIYSKNLQAPEAEISSSLRVEFCIQYILIVLCSTAEVPTQAIVGENRIKNNHYLPAVDKNDSTARVSDALFRMRLTTPT